MARRFGFETNGIGFYLFDDIADPKAFKDVYREQLDAAPWDAAEQERVIDEVLLAYRFNTELFDDLAARQGRARSPDASRRRERSRAGVRDGSRSSSPRRRAAAMKRCTSGSTRMSLGRSGRDRYRPSSEVSRDSAT